eukprot:jgi/Chrzof1/3141/Cz12g13110.t1
MPDCVGVLKYGLYSVRPALPESRSFQMVLEVPRCFQMFLDVSKCVQKFLEPERHRGPTLKHRPQHRAEDTESLERLRQQISISKVPDLGRLVVPWVPPPMCGRGLMGCGSALSGVLFCVYCRRTCILLAVSRHLFEQSQVELAQAMQFYPGLTTKT